MFVPYSTFWLAKPAIYVLHEKRANDTPQEFEHVFFGLASKFYASFAVFFFSFLKIKTWASFGQLTKTNYCSPNVNHCSYLVQAEAHPKILNNLVSRPIRASQRDLMRFKLRVTLYASVLLLPYFAIIP